MSKPAAPTYRTTNWRDYNAALRRRGSLVIWFDPKATWVAAPGGCRGRPATFSDAAIQTCLTLKALFGLPLRQTTGLVASLIELAGLNGPVPDFSTLCRRQKGLVVQIPYRSSTGALHLLIDSTGIKAAGEGEWSTRKHGASRLRSWRKVHLGTMPKPWRSARSRSPAAGSVTDRCLANSWRRSRPRSPSASSPPTGPTTHGPVTPPLPLVGPRL